jgi:hypothetical protein
MLKRNHFQVLKDKIHIRVEKKPPKTPTFLPKIQNTAIYPFSPLQTKCTWLQQAKG